MGDEPETLPARTAGERPPNYPLPRNTESDSAHTAADYALSARTEERIADGVPANTRRAYARQWAAFTAWCADSGRIALPATAHTLAEYTSSLCEVGQAPASIEQAIAAVRTMHRLAGHTGRPATESARLVLRAYKRQRAEDGGRGQREAPPITIDALRAMVSACDLDTPIGRRDRLLLVLGLALMGRRSELVALTRQDVREVADGLVVPPLADIDGRPGVRLPGGGFHTVTLHDGVVMLHHADSAIPLGDASQSPVQARALSAALQAVTALPPHREHPI